MNTSSKLINTEKVAIYLYISKKKCNFAGKFNKNVKNLAVQRVAKRVSTGGHDIPVDVIYRRYQLGLCNFFHLYKDIVDTWTLVDNATNPRQVIATDEEIVNVELYNKIEAYVKQ